MRNAKAVTLNATGNALSAVLDRFCSAEVPTKFHKE